MADQIKTEDIYQLAESLLVKGEPPTSGRIAEELGCSEESVVSDVQAWWRSLSQRVQTQPSSLGVAAPVVPASLAESFERIWQQAVQEAHDHFNLEQHFQEADQSETVLAGEEQLAKLRRSLHGMEERYRAEVVKVTDGLTHVRALEAEIQVLKVNLATESTARKQEEQKRSNLEQDLAHLRKSFDDSRRTFDQRIKDEQRHALEAIGKADADVRYYRNALEKVRDEAGKKESALERINHDLQGEIAKKDVKLESQKTQIRSLDEELKQIKQDSGSRNREISKLNSQLLAEVNKTKRLVDRSAELEQEIKQLQQKVSVSVQDAARREQALRKQLKEREEELMRVSAKVAVLDKRNITQDEEIRRLNARL